MKGPAKGVPFLMSVSLLSGLTNGHTGAVDKMDAELAAHYEHREKNESTFSAFCKEQAKGLPKKCLPLHRCATYTTRTHAYSTYSRTHTHTRTLNCPYHFVMVFTHRTVLSALDGLEEGDKPERVSKGDISSVFGSLVGETFEWPVRFGDIKDRIRPDATVSLLKQTGQGTYAVAKGTRRSRFETRFLDSLCLLSPPLSSVSLPVSLCLPPSLYLSPLCCCVTLPQEGCEDLQTPTLILSCQPHHTPRN
jgi:hypothetical protein